MWWYYQYKADESIPLTETSCQGYNGCRTEILIHEREAFDDASISYVPYKYAEMILTCTYQAYCYPADDVYMYNDPNTLVYHTEDSTEYTHKVRRIVECCNGDNNCNEDESGLYANAYAGASAVGVSAGAVVAAAAGAAWYVVAGW